MKKNLRSIGFYGIILLLLVAVLAFTYKEKPQENLSYAETLNLFRQEQWRALCWKATS